MKKLLIILFFFFLSCSPDDKWVDQYEQELLNNLDDPETYEFVSFSLGKLYKGAEERKAYHRYRIENSKGNKKLHKAVILFDDEGNFLRIEDVDDSNNVLF